MEIARGVEDRTVGKRWTVLMSNSARDTGREQRYLREYAERRVAGLIVIPNDQVSEGTHRLPHGDIPMVVVDRAETGPDHLSVLNLESSWRFVITGVVLAVAVGIDSLARRSRASHGRA